MKKERRFFNVFYVGLSAVHISGIHGRTKKQRVAKEDLWTHCSVFEVNDTIRDEEIRELEGLLRDIYRKDERANRFNKLRSYRKFKRITSDIESWRRAEDETC